MYVSDPPLYSHGTTTAPRHHGITAIGPEAERAEEIEAEWLPYFPFHGNRVVDAVQKVHTCIHTNIHTYMNGTWWGVQGVNNSLCWP